MLLLLFSTLLIATLLAISTKAYGSDILQWLRRKRYQYEVTYALYMLTPTEKFILDSILFLITSMILIAASLYLPSYLSFLVNRAWYYYSGSGVLQSPAGAASPGLHPADVNLDGGVGPVE